MYGRLSTRGGSTEQHVVRLEQVPRWIEQEPLSPSASHSESEASDCSFVDPLTSLAGTFFRDTLLNLVNLFQKQSWQKLSDSQFYNVELNEVKAMSLLDLTIH